MEEAIAGRHRLGDVTGEVEDYVCRTGVVVGADLAATADGHLDLELIVQFLFEFDRITRREWGREHLHIPLTGVGADGRQARERVAALVLANSRATAEAPEGRANRQKSIDAVQQRGPAQFIDEMIPRLLARTTLETRQDLVAGARQMMSRMSVQGIVANQQGMMQRPDSIPTLKTISVPVLLIGGEEDTATPLAEAALMKQHIPNARLEVVPRAGHYAAFEQPEYVGRLLRSFVDGLSL